MIRRMKHYAAYLPHSTVVVWDNGNTGYLKAVQNDFDKPFDGFFTFNTVIGASVTLTHTSIQFCATANMNQLLMVLKKPTDFQLKKAKFDPDFRDKLIENNYDVFGLLERKEAVPAGALPFEPYPDYKIVTEWKVNTELIDANFYDPDGLDIDGIKEDFLGDIDDDYYEDYYEDDEDFY